MSVRQDSPAGVSNKSPRAPVVETAGLTLHSYCTSEEVRTVPTRGPELRVLAAVAGGQEDAGGRTLMHIALTPGTRMALAPGSLARESQPMGRRIPLTGEAQNVWTVRAPHNKPSPPLANTAAQRADLLRSSQYHGQDTSLRGGHHFTHYSTQPEDSGSRPCSSPSHTPVLSRPLSGDAPAEGPTGDRPFPFDLHTIQQMDVVVQRCRFAPVSSLLTGDTRCPLRALQEWARVPRKHDPGLEGRAAGQLRSRLSGSGRMKSRKGQACQPAEAWSPQFSGGHCWRQNGPTPLDHYHEAPSRLHLYPHAHTCVTVCLPPSGLLCCLQRGHRPPSWPVAA